MSDKAFVVFEVFQSSAITYTGSHDNIVIVLGFLGIRMRGSVIQLLVRLIGPVVSQLKCCSSWLCFWEFWCSVIHYFLFFRFFYCVRVSNYWLDLISFRISHLKCFCVRVFWDILSALGICGGRQFLINDGSPDPSFCWVVLHRGCFWVIWCRF